MYDRKSFDYWVDLIDYLNENGIAKEDIIHICLDNKKIVLVYYAKEKLNE